MQKTVYEMRISDLSSDVCSSDLRAGERHRAQPAIVGGAIVDEDVSAARVRRDQPVRAGTAIIECDATDFLADPAEPGRVDQRRRDLGFGIGVEPPDTDRFLGDVERPAAICGNAMLGFGGGVELPFLASIALAVGACNTELPVR